jgi:hypothetical protein
VTWILFALAGWILAGIGWYRARAIKIVDGVLKDRYAFLAAIILQMGGTLRITKRALIRAPLEGGISRWEDFPSGDIIFKLVEAKPAASKGGEG